MIMANTIKIKDDRSTYPGGKGGSGVYQNIINLIPPHDVYIETHLGGGSIMRQKRPASINIGIDLDPEVIKNWEAAHIFKINDSRPDVCRTKTARSDTNKKNDIGSGTASPKIMSGDDQYFTVINDDATRYLKTYKFIGNEFVYVDPPYLMETRKGGKLYQCEMTESQHIELLSCLKDIPAKVMISGYWSSLYDRTLPGWNTHHFEAQTRQGMATEWVWFNYRRPETLHDYSFLGSTFRQRERIKKKRDRWISRLLKTPVLERNAILEGLINCLPDPTSSKKQMRSLSSFVGMPAANSKNGDGPRGGNMPAASSKIAI